MLNALRVRTTRRLEFAMNKLQKFSILAASLSFGIIGCQMSPSGTPVLVHKLVVTGNEHSIPVYQNEQDYLSTSNMKQQGGVTGVVGDVKQGLTAKQLDDQTPVQIVTSDENGAVITVTDGPMKGQTGFVAKQNVD
jgi:hypothetical protein